MLYADVIVDISARALDRPFQYLVPKELEGRLDVGSVVTVPFGGANRQVTGYVLAFSDKPALDCSKIKPLSRAVLDSGDEEKRLTGLAVWIRDRYGSTMLQALRTVLPVKRKIRPVNKRMVILLLKEESALRSLELMKRRRQSARARVMEALISEGAVPYELLTQKLNVSAAAIKGLEKDGLIRVDSERVYRQAAMPDRPQGSFAGLNDEQQKIRDAIIADWDTERTGKYLIRGVTGSGKTEIYIELIAYAVSRNEQAIVLIPEISLTYQTMMRFYRRFGDRVSVIHSRMSPGERYDQFERAKNGGIDVMIGPRSALFTPFPSLGIIVIDEEHEESYRSEQSPRYHAREVAFKRGEMEGARVVLGSATPSVDAYFAAKKGDIKLFNLDKRAKDAMLPELSLIDMRREKGREESSLFSKALISEMGACLERGEQMMLFLNRRGYASFLSCRSCGHVIRCPHCDVSLTLHNDGRMRCHYCGYIEPVPDKCPGCGGEYLRPFRAGTQQLEEETGKLFPAARILRLDKDTSSKKDAQGRILGAFASHEADILIGTQMIVKGHDFPDVTLVGIVLADLSLNVPDYRAAERTFQLLTQAAGRAGRDRKRGKVVIQTYMPDHYAVRAAMSQDYERFYEREMDFRNLALYPPAGMLLAIHLSSEDNELLGRGAYYIRRFLEKILAKTSAVILGPSEESIARVNDIYRMVIYLRTASPKLVRAAKNRLEKYIDANEGFSKIDIQFDLNR